MKQYSSKSLGPIQRVVEGHISQEPAVPRAEVAEVDADAGPQLVLHRGGRLPVVVLAVEAFNGVRRIPRRNQVLPERPVRPRAALAVWHWD